MNEDTVKRIVVDPNTKVTVIEYCDGRTEVIIPDKIRDGVSGVVSKIDGGIRGVSTFTKKTSDFFKKIMSGINFILKGFYTLLLKYPALMVTTLVLVAGGIVIMMVKKDFNLGGLIGKLWGKEELSNVERANIIPEDRDVPIGTPDKEGFVQHKVEKADISINPFRDKSKIKLTNGKEIKLPKGVKDKDVDTIMEIAPEVYVVRDPNRNKAKTKLEKKIKDREDFISNLKRKYGV